MTQTSVLQTRNLKKYFGSIHAVEDVSLDVKQGEIFGFLGPNGAGKTTTISMILGLTTPTAGEVAVFDQPVTPTQNSVLRRVGTMVGSSSLMLPFSARRNLQCMAYLRPDLPPKRIDEVLEVVGLQDIDNRQVRKFSTGMKQRLGLALALINKPDLLILDEPTNGMDPSGMHEVRTLLRSLAKQGITIFLSSHLLHEIELITDRVAVINHGRVVTQGKVTDLLTTSQDVIVIRTSEPEKTAQVLRELPTVSSVEVNPNSVEVQGISSEAALSHLVTQGIVPKEVLVSHPDLESVFLELTQKA